LYVAAHREGNTAAETALTAAVARYTGDFLEEDPYDDWSVSLREQARSACLSAVRVLAEIAQRSGDNDAAAHRARRPIAEYLT
jgi:hypothetical protein